jgi:ATP-dependent exoDNAse (exonuclease V) beta subunit
MLQERPLECGVSPGFRVADESETDVLFADSWEEWLSSRLTGGDATLLEAMDSGIPLEAENVYGERTALRGFARTLLDQRDLEPLVSAAAEPPQWRRDLLEKADRARSLGAGVQPGDVLGERLKDLVAFAEQSRFLEGSALLAHLKKLPVLRSNSGFKPRWPSEEALKEGREVAAWTQKASAEWKAALGADLHGRLVRELSGVVAIYDRRKAQAGLLDFLDLLLRARNALRDSPAVARYFRRRFRYLIIDEFQDTDPLQVEVARLLTKDRPESLVVVGDAKQSIYRFRRADVALFRALSERAACTPGQAVLHLVQNFRSRPAILRFVNRVFVELIQHSVEVDQPAYEAIAPPPGLDDGPAVLALRFEASFSEGRDLLQAEAAALAALVGEAARGRLEVRDPVNGEARKSRAGDVMVLTRRLTQVRQLEDALDARGLRFAVEGGKSFFDRQEVHEVLAVLRAVEDASDRVSLVAALRSTFLGVSDRDIAGYCLAGGYLSMGAVDESRPGASALGPALGLLQRLHQLRTRLSVAALLELLYAETRILAAFTGTRRGEARIANLEKVAALARQSAELGVLTLRGFTALLQERISTAREEPDLPSTRPGDLDTVRILTIHKAKGLEAPIVALFDSADDYATSASVIPLWEEGRVAVGFRAGCQPAGWDALTRSEAARAGAEGKRLLYVAATRARDWLVIPKPPHDARSGAFWRELSSRLPHESDADVRVVDAATLPAGQPEGTGEDLRPLALASGGDKVALDWNEERRELVRGASKPVLEPVKVTALSEATWPVEALAGAGRGRDFGRLVHAILERAAIDRPQDLAGIARALAPRFGLGDEAADEAAGDADRTLAMPILARARAASSVFRELRLWFPDDGRLVEGVIDLVFEEEGGLVLVDYKTHPVSEGQLLEQAERHKTQLQLYGRGLAQAAGLRVKERLVLFTAIGRAVPV